MSYFPWHDKSRRKRILLFTGGGHVDLYVDVEDMKARGKSVKKWGVFVDVVNFWIEGPYEDSKRALDAFVDAVNVNENSHIIHIAADKTMTAFDDIISRYPEIFSLEEGVIARYKEAKEVVYEYGMGRGWVWDMDCGREYEWAIPTNEKVEDNGKGKNQGGATHDDDDVYSFDDITTWESMISEDRLNYVHRELIPILEIVRSMPRFDEVNLDLAPNNVTHDESVKARGMERGEDEREIAKNKKSKDNEKGKNQGTAAHDKRVKERGMEHGKHNSLVVQNKFAALSLLDI
ncbi:uncharacterized protein [Rutidosis leptorrhynchoides]